LTKLNFVYSEKVKELEKSGDKPGVRRIFLGPRSLKKGVKTRAWGRS
jgi:hypothetical protein